VLIIGVGSIGERHLRCFQATGRAELALVETNPDLRRSVAERLAVAQSHPNVDSALRDWAPDVAVIATPAPAHVPIATTLAEAGVHVLIEKPLSTRIAGIDRLQEVVRGRGLVAGVAYVYRSHPLLRALRQALAENRFGRPVELVAVAGQHFPTYRPAYRTIYYNDHETGGGAIQDALTHLINAGEWLVGPVTRLVADAAHQVLDGVTVEDTIHVLARHGAGAGTLASYSLNQHQAANEVTVTVICEGGVARCELHAHRWRWMTAPEGGWHDETIEPLQRDALFVTQAHEFLDAVEAGRAPACSLDEGLQALRVNLAALESVRTQSWHEVDVSARMSARHEHPDLREKPPE
jgi:predicted dehydrogenase